MRAISVFCHASGKCRGSVVSKSNDGRGRWIRRSRLVQIVYVTVFTGGLIWSPPPASAQETGQRAQDISIESTSLSAAIVELSRETGVPIFAASSLTRNVTIAPVKGRYTVRDALREMLEGTGLVIGRDNRGHLVITEPPETAPPREDKTRVARVEPDATARVRAEDSEATQRVFDEIQVTGIRGSMGNALRTKRRADIVSEVVSAQDFGKFPDQNIAEGLQRVPGVTITRVGGEGQQVILRGLAPGFVNVTLNGVATPSANPGRDFDFDVFPSELFSLTTIAKSPAADMIEGGVAGTINLRTPRPFDFDGVRIVGSAQSIWTPRANAQDPRTHIAVSDTFGDMFGALLAVSYSESSERTDGVQSIGWSNRNFDIDGDGTVELPGIAYPRIPIPISDSYDRERLSVAGALQFRPGDSTEVNLDLLYAQYDRRRDRASINARPVGGGEDFISLTADERNAIATGVLRNLTTSSVARLTENEQDFFQISVDGQKDVGNWTISALASYSSAVDDEVRDVEVALEGRGIVSLDFTDPSIFPEIDYGFDVLDPQFFEFGRVLNSPTRVENDGHSLQLDFSRPLASGITSEFRFGVRYEDREHSASGRSLNSGAYIGRIDAGTVSSPLVGDFADHLDAPDGFPRAWLVPDIGAILTELDAEFLRGGFDFGGTYSVQEDVTAGYLQLDLDSSLFGIPVTGNAGVRVVYTDQVSIGTQFLGNEDDPVEFRKNYTDILPSANLKLHFSEELLLRLSAARVVTRPAPEDLAPRWLVEQRTRMVRFGNPALEPFGATQFDASLEWYFDKDAALSIAAFYKDAESFITPSFSTATLSELEPASVPQGPPDQVYSVTRFENGLGAKLSGVEISYQQPFTFLPAPFDGLGAMMNYTYVDSEGRVARNGETVTLPLQQQSRHSSNLVAYYERDGLALRAAYNWRDKFLVIPFDRGNTQVFRDSAGYLDMFASYDVSDSVTVTFEALNVTDTDVYEYAGTKDRFIYYEATGPRYFAGLSFRF